MDHWLSFSPTSSGPAASIGAIGTKWKLAEEKSASSKISKMGGLGLGGRGQGVCRGMIGGGSAKVGSEPGEDRRQRARSQGRCWARDRDSVRRCQVCDQVTGGE